jgi:hypothetical protein
LKHPADLLAGNLNLGKFFSCFCCTKFPKGQLFIIVVLPDFSWYNIPKRGENIPKHTKVHQNIPNTSIHIYEYGIQKYLIAMKKIYSVSIPRPSKMYQNYDFEMQTYNLATLMLAVYIHIPKTCRGIHTYFDYKKQEEAFALEFV